MSPPVVTAAVSSVCQAEGCPFNMTMISFSVRLVSEGFM